MECRTRIRATAKYLFLGVFCFLSGYLGFNFKDVTVTVLMTETFNPAAEYKPIVLTLVEATEKVQGILSLDQNNTLSSENKTTSTQSNTTSIQNSTLNIQNNTTISLHHILSSRAVVMPVYAPHFDFLCDFFTSMIEKSSGFDNITFLVVTSSPEETHNLTIRLENKQILAEIPFLEIIDVFSMLHSMNLTVPNNYNQDTPKWGFQGIKKLYGAVYTNCSQILLLDAEAIVLRSVNWHTIFDNYFEAPYYILARVAHTEDRDSIMADTLAVLGYSMSAYPKGTFSFEYQVWFLERHLLLAMMAQIERHHKQPLLEVLPRFIRAFEIAMYESFLFFNRHLAPHYTVHTDIELVASFFKDKKERWIQQHHRFEKFLSFAAPDTIDGMADLANFLRFPFVRIPDHWGSFDLLRKLMQKVPTLAIQVCSDIRGVKIW